LCLLRDLSLRDFRIIFCKHFWLLSCMIHTPPTIEYCAIYVLSVHRFHANTVEETEFGIFVLLYDNEVKTTKKKIAVQNIILISFRIFLILMLFLPQVYDW
jgi:hypothetical protein